MREGKTTKDLCFEKYWTKLQDTKGARKQEMHKSLLPKQKNNQLPTPLHEWPPIYTSPTTSSGLPSCAPYRFPHRHSSNGTSWSDSPSSPTSLESHSGDCEVGEEGESLQLV